MVNWHRFLSLAQSKLRLCMTNHMAGYFSNLACDWLSVVWAYSEQETELGPCLHPWLTFEIEKNNFWLKINVQDKKQT